MQGVPRKEDCCMPAGGEMSGWFGKPQWHPPRFWVRVAQTILALLGLALLGAGIVWWIWHG